MSSNANRTSSFSQEQELILPKITNVSQLDKIWERLDTILLALQAITDLTPQNILQIAKELNLESVIAERRGLWRLPPSDSESKSSRNQQLEIKKARSLVLIICHLAQQHQELIRRSVSLLEQATEENQPPESITLLAKYLDKFLNIYQESTENRERISSERLSQLALKTLIDLLFYSGNNGHYLLWSVILENSC
ncbi:DUF3038 domain-containing protein [Pleurocapsales cyanobacterium LEGE 06147]|nr:DUF3038 domain-containing protein [Pleurocapsales cyanobacterium LEGE 06147]